jgi:hypothetical protein
VRDLLSWNELLADDVRLSLRLGTLDVSRLGDLQAASGNLEVFGKAQAKEVLQRIYGDLRKRLSITTEVVSVYDAIVFGNLALTTNDGGIESLPMGVFMAFDARGRAVTIPMYGMGNSLNVATTAAILLNWLSQQLTGAAQFA